MLGAPAWRSSAVARGEMGWCISGAGLATLEAAKKRAKLWLLPPADFFRLSFVTGHKDQTSWASISLHTFTTWGISDWPKWSVTVPSPSMKGYSEYVRATATRRSVTKWSAAAGKHVQPVPYLSIMQRPGQHLEMAIQANLPLDTLSTNARCAG